MRCLHTLLFLIFSLSIYAQEVDISGVIMDSQSLPAPGGYVINQTKRDTIKVHNFDAIFNFKANIGDRLDFYAPIYDSICYPKKTKIVEGEAYYEIKLLHISEIEYFECQKYPEKIHVLIGELTHLEEVDDPYDCYSMDREFDLEFDVLKVIHGDYSEKTIRFNAFEHVPSLERTLGYSKYALFIVRQWCGNRYLLEKYELMDVYRTVDNKYAIRYSPRFISDSSELILEPKLIQFSNLKFPLTEKSLKFLEREENAMHFDIYDDYFIPKTGYYAEDFFDYLKSKERYRKLFD